MKSLSKELQLASQHASDVFSISDEIARAETEAGSILHAEEGEKSRQQRETIMDRGAYFAQAACSLERAHDKNDGERAIEQEVRAASALGDESIANRKRSRCEMEAQAPILEKYLESLEERATEASVANVEIEGLKGPLQQMTASRDAWRAEALSLRRRQ